MINIGRFLESFLFFNAMIKVLMFGWEFPPHNSGGLGTACLGLTKAMISEDVKITFVLPRRVEISENDKFKVKFADESLQSVNVKYVNSYLMPYMTSDDYVNYLKKNKLGLKHGRNLYEEVELYAARVQELIGDEDYDIIHAHDWMSFKAGLEAKRILGKPLVVHIHSTEVDRTGGTNLNDYIYQAEKTGMEQADQVITVSNFTKDLVEKYYGIPGSKIEVVHNGIDLDSYDSAPTEEENSINQFKEAGFKVVLFVGRITIQKGPDYFLLAAKRVLEYNPKVIFVVTGSGDMEYKIINMAAELGIGDKVLFTGFLRGPELQSIYKLADLFVMPSVSEPFGLTALESALSGTPVLVSKQTGVSEVLTHVLTADFWDTEEMASKILAVLNYDSLQMSLKQNGQDQVRAINWKAASEKCVAIYRSLLDKYFHKPGFFSNP
jgi:glycogen synthase